MKRLGILACLRSKEEQLEESPLEVRAEGAANCDESNMLVRTIGWVSVAAGMVALGYYVGRQLRARYHFRHRTPYDFYSHAGDEINNGTAEYGVGI
ncbi:MAG TPA: hypothetical protein VMU62_05690 [Acidobacteriaceae bacterium]|nr:hypothetical protein [Acidobacteriaceae bacterium]